MKWAMPGTRHILAFRMSSVLSTTALHRFTSRNFVLLHVSLLFTSLKCSSFLSTVTPPTQSTSTRTKPSVSTRTMRLFHAAVTPLPRRRPPRRADTPLTQLPRHDDTPDARPTPLPRRADAAPTPHSGSDDAAAAPEPCRCPTHAAAQQ